MLMKRGTKLRSSKWENVVDFTLGLAAALVVIFVHAPDKWFAAVYCTGVPFLGTIWCFKKRWHAVRFWSMVAVLFVIHVAIMWFIFAVLLRTVTEVGLPVCLPFILLESALLYYTVKRLGEPQLVGTSSNL
jgi:apolipoprotein N-acyltransferase